MRTLILFGSCWLASLSAQAPDPVAATLTIDGGRDHFQSGEPIVLDLTFTTTGPDYSINLTTTTPASPVDTLVVAPMTGIFPWLDDEARGHRYVPDYAVTGRLTVGEPVTVKLPLNAVYRFDQPGRYSVHVVTKRVYRDRATGEGIPLTSNEVAFDVEMMTGETETQRAATLLRTIRESTDLRRAQRAADALDWLTGEASTRVKLDLLLHPKRFYPFAVDVNTGLWVARDRALVVAELERALDDPTQPVSSLLMPAVLLKARLEAPFDPAAAAAPLPEQRIRTVYLQRISRSLAKRSGESLIDAARMILAELVRGQQTDTPEFAAAREAVITHFADVNEYNVDTLLNVYGKYLLDARMAPALRKILDQQSNPVMNGERSAVLEQLVKISPMEGRAALIREVCGFNPMVLQITAELPSGPLPETDECLRRQMQSLASAGNARERLRLGWAMEFAAHYASSALYDDVLGLYGSGSPGLMPDARGYALAYLAHWDAQRGIPLLESALPVDTQNPDSSLTYALGRAYSPQLLPFLVKRMNDSPPTLAGYAAWQLAEHAPAEDRALVTTRLQRWRTAWQGRTIPAPEGNLEAELTQAAVRGKNWQASDTEAASLRAECLSAECKTRMAIQH